MKLLYQTHSPYARKVLVFAHEAGLADAIEVVHHETSPTRRNEAVVEENPLGQVPVLVRPGKPSIFDSDVICAGFRKSRPRLTVWFDTFESRASMRATPLAGETHD